MEEQNALQEQLKQNLGEGEALKSKLAEENEALRKKLEDQLTASTKLSLEKEAGLIQEIDSLTEKLVSEVFKSREL